MAENLVIVESPAKAKTISNFLGKDYLVKSCFGHIRDLHEKELSVDLKHHYRPKYFIPEEKKKVIDELKKYSDKAKVVWLATDEDREGEAISWHLVEALGLSEDKVKRIVFHEITKTAIMQAIENPRAIDKKLVDAQQARRVLDRLVGYELSPVLWKKVKPALSAGRVQSVAVRLLVEREREVNSFSPTSFFKTTGYFSGSSGSRVLLFKAELNRKFTTEQDVHQFLSKLTGASFTVQSVEKKPVKRTPPPPFITSTLQQEAGRKFGYSVAQTMRLAQRLYEAGKITYMRTDSVNLSGFALNAAKNEITRLFGSDYVHKRQYETKSHLAQEAHEAIRPTYMNTQDIETDDEKEAKLYDLIWKRAIASQMKDAEIEKTIVSIASDRVTDLFIATGEVIIFDGYLKVYLETKDDEDDDNETDENVIPAVEQGSAVDIDKVISAQRFSQPPSRFTEPALVKKLEALGIGRPSTYAPIISTIQKRGYVVKETRQGQKRDYLTLTLQNGAITKEINSENTGFEKNKLFPTDIGMVVNDFLEKEFPAIMDYNFTAKVEEEFDTIAEGSLKWTEMMDEFYVPFHKTVSQVTSQSEKVTGERELGKDPVTGKKVIVRIGRYGPIVQMGESDGKDKPTFSSLRVHQRIDTITLEEALDLLKLPRNLGAFENNDILVDIGRFGPYVKHENKYFPLLKSIDIFSVTLEQAVDVIEKKRIFDRERTIKTFTEAPDVKVLKGKWGPYISIGKNNYKIPKELDPATLTLEDCNRIASESKKSGKTGAGRTKKSK